MLLKLFAAKTEYNHPIKYKHGCISEWHMKENHKYSNLNSLLYFCPLCSQWSAVIGLRGAAFVREREDCRHQCKILQITSHLALFLRTFTAYLLPLFPRVSGQFLIMWRMVKAFLIQYNLTSIRFENNQIIKAAVISMLYHRWIKGHV